ncbi:MAG: sulfatase-like hydrolase/transferase [Bacteroidia bacterium]
MKKIVQTVFLTLFFQSVKAQQNTILIIADDVSPDYFSFSPDAKDTAITPNINTLAANGIRFIRAWANPVCSPTRASMFSGRYPFRTGVGTVITNNMSAQLDTSEMTIAKLLKYYAPVQYNTGCVGKWHITAPIPPKYLHPNKMGYNFYSGNLSGALPDFYSYPRVTNGVIDTVTLYATTQTVNDAIGWMDTMNTSKPFFLWLAFNAPHFPYHKPPDSLITNTGLSGTPADILAQPKEYFKAMIEAMDTEIGRLFQYLNTNNLMDSTNIIFIGDNGNEQDVAQVTPFQAKATLYDYGVHVPFIISGPAVVNPNRESDALVSTTDLFATIAELCGFNNWLNFIPANKLPVDAKSILPIIKNQTTVIRDWNFTEQFATPTTVKDGKTIRNLNYQLLRFDNGIEKMYNMITDTLELNNLLAGNLTAIEISNYHSLCDTLSALVGTSNCTSLSINEADENVNSLVTVSNPFTGNLFIHADADLKNATVSLMDVTGWVIEKWEVNLVKNNSTSLKLSTEIPQGIYFLNVKTSTQNFSIKLMHE